EVGGEGIAIEPTAARLPHKQAAPSDRAHERVRGDLVRLAEGVQACLDRVRQRLDETGAERLPEPGPRGGWKVEEQREVTLDLGGCRLSPEGAERMGRHGGP